jgi:hypothetical protein
MPNFDVDRESVEMFRVGEQYLFTAYIDNQAIFEQVREYYNDTEYRFEVPVEEFETVCDCLEEAYLDPVEVTDPEPYCVVVETYDQHAKILRDAVATWERRGHRFFLMESELATADAVERGATPVAETEFVVGL